jgi:hypothetical protein
VDRASWNHHTADYYNQIHQEYDQYASQPEAGQTSAGVPASGLSWSYLAPGQSQMYLSFNVPPKISPSPGSDWEYLLPPTSLENSIQDVPGQSNAQPATKAKRQRRCLAEITEQFLADLDKYARGDTLQACSASLNFRSYVTDAGYLKPNGINLYNKLEQKDKDRVDQALEDRRSFRPSTMKRFLDGLEAYASGALLQDCSTTVNFFRYVTDAGYLKPYGTALYNKLEQKDKDRVDQALKDRKERPDRDKVRTSFLEGLEAYASGAPLKACSETLDFHLYVSSKGFLQDSGIALYNRLEQRDQNLIDDALSSRRAVYSNERNATDHALIEGFLGGIEAYANGTQLTKCSETFYFENYVTADGRLQKPGRKLFDRLSTDDKIWVKQALTSRRRIAAQQISGDIPLLRDALAPYGNGLELQACGKVSGLEKIERYLTPEGGLTAKGELLIENLEPDQQYDVWYEIVKRQKLLNPSAQEPGSPWQLPEIPVSMPEMGGMDPAAMTAPIQTETMVAPIPTETMVAPIPMETMVAPMQTEAMWATAWQLTGQAVPGTWGIPSESAEPSIPYYDSEAFRADFQHQYGPYADQYPGRGV